MPTLRERLRRTYFVLDARSLGLFRIVFAAVLSYDLCLRQRVLDSFYTNAGLLPNHTLLWAPPSGHVFSLFFCASTHAEAALLMALCQLTFLALGLGLYTRLAQLASFVAIVSLNTRVALLENGGDMVMNLLAMWSLFLPLGRRFSIDALLASLRARKEVSADELAERVALHAGPHEHGSLAAVALILQFGVIYLFNVLHKGGPTWLEGSAVHYVLQQDRFVTGFGFWLREHAPYPVLRALSYLTMGIELLGALAILTPFGTRRARTFAVLVLPALHLGFALCLRLGIFSFAMIAFFPLLLQPEHWAWLQRTLQRWHRPRTVFFDSSCGICFLTARVLARMDLFGKLTLLANTDHARLPPGVPAEMVDSTIVVVDAETGALHTRARAIAELLRALPGGFLLALPLSLPGLHQLANAAYDRIAHNRARISVFFGMAACGLPGTRAQVAMPDATSEASDLLARARHHASEGLVALLMLAALGDLLNDNPVVPKALRVPVPVLLERLVEYPRTYQSWRMFAPHVPTDDLMIEVDALTV
ncbi:MAG TPA: DCC1-like thiol-disulfide oxidoreductase family protein, partial [Polyangiales bacterium]|nr:DCC1-like thiol-disulfide oxidoreductase family protein [Polyangiales bacterium]